MASAQDLIAAAARGDVAAVQRLVVGGAASRRATPGRTALLAATQGDHVEAARVLIAAGADVNAKDNIQDSAYLYAGAEGRLEILRLTLTHGADLASVNRYGGTALIPAAHHGHVETVRLLLTTRINIDHVNRLGWTALLEAIILGDGGPAHTEIVRLLVGAGAAVNLADRDGVTPLAHARQRGQAEIVRILEAKGARCWAGFFRGLLPRLGSRSPPSPARGEGCTHLSLPLREREGPRASARGRVRGPQGQSLQDCVVDAVETLQDVVVPEACDGEALRLEPCCAALVCVIVGVLSAVDFDD